MEMPVVLDRRGAIAVLTLDRPRRLNALSADLRQALIDRVRALDADASVRAVVLGIPGDSPAIVSSIEGYKMALKGRAGHALTISAVSSFVASILGIRCWRCAARCSPPWR
jgi:TctA family transporter